MRVSHLAIISGLALLSGHVMAACPVKTRITEPTVFLIDKSDRIVKGPVDFGTHTTKWDFASEYMVKSTDYRILVYPARIRIDSDRCNICVSVKKIAPVCRGASTYSVGVGMVFSGRPGATSPYQIDDAINLRFDDPGEVHEPSVKIAFDARMVGTLVQTK